LVFVLDALGPLVDRHDSIRKSVEVMAPNSEKRFNKLAFR
jgi:hypothetical protein